MHLLLICNYKYIHTHKRTARIDACDALITSVMEQHQPVIELQLGVPPVHKESADWKWLLVEAR